MKNQSNENLPAWISPWLYHHASRKLPSQTAECRQFLEAVWPASNNYASPLCPIFLAECIDLDFLATRPIWLIRDGLVPLLWFFQIHPRPKSRKTEFKLLVLEKLAPYIPEAWRKHFGTYQIVSSKPKKSANAQKLFITGLVMDSYCSLESLDEQLLPVRKWQRNTPDESIEHLAFLPSRSDLGSSFSSQFVLNLGRAIGGKIHCIDYQKLISIDSLAGYALIELNDTLLCADSFLSHAALSAGAVFLDPGRQIESTQQIEKNAAYIELSPFHGMVVQENISKASSLNEARTAQSELSEHSRIYHRALRSKANLKYPWPEWLMDWSKERKLTSKKKKRAR